MIGTSIGAINAAFIAGNEPENRVPALREFWRRMAHKSIWHEWSAWPRFVAVGVLPDDDHRRAAGVLRAQSARFPRTARAPRRRPRRFLFDGAAGADARRAARLLAHRAQQAATDGGCRARAHQPHALFRQPQRGAQRQAHPGVRRAAAGIPRRAHRRRAVLGRRHPLQHADRSDLRREPARQLARLRRAHVEPARVPSRRRIWEVLHRQKDIQYSSRVATHIARQAQIHRLRHIIRELASLLPDDVRRSEAVRALTAYGCLTRMHVVRLLWPGHDDEDHTKDIDFSPSGIRKRWEAGYEKTMRAIDGGAVEGRVRSDGGRLSARTPRGGADGRRRPDP